MRRTIALFVALALGLGTGAPVLADCCDSFFGCAAAYVTDGLSCVLQQIVSTIRSLVDLLNNLSSRVSGVTQRASDEARQYVSDTIAATRTDAQQGEATLADAERQAQDVYTQETSLVSVAQTLHLAPSSTFQQKGGAPPPTPTATSSARAISAKPNAARPGMATSVEPTPPPHGALRGLFEKGLAEVRSLKAAGDQDAPRLSTLMTQAEQSEGPALQSALDAADAAISAPIRNMLSRLNGMLSDPTSLFDPTDMVTNLSDSVLANLDTNVDQMVNAITAGPQKAFDAAQPLHDELVGNAARAAQIAAAMQTAYAKRTQASQVALSELLPRGAVPAGAKAVELGGRRSFAQIQLAFRKNVESIRPAASERMQALKPLLAQYKALRAEALAARSKAPAYRSDFGRRLDAACAGKTQAEILAQRDQWIADARRQFAGDPKTRDAVIALITSESSKVRTLAIQKR